MTSGIIEQSMTLAIPDEMALVGESWERRADEPAEAHDAFFFYRALLPTERTVHNAWRQMLAVRDPARLEALKQCKAPSTWLSWELLYDWEARALDFDEAFRGQLLRAEEDALAEMVDRHQRQLTNLQVMGMEYLEDNGFDTAAAALRAVHHSMDREQRMAGIPDVSELVVMDADALKRRFADLIDLLARARE